jgi:hypothetical protein
VTTLLLGDDLAAAVRLVRILHPGECLGEVFERWRNDVRGTSRARHLDDRVEQSLFGLVSKRSHLSISNRFAVTE